MSNDKKHNHLAAAEMGEEGNYNMIDGIINNSNKPSILEHIMEHERRIAENSRTAEKQKDNTQTRELR
jgi:hypothetical protein